MQACQASHGVGKDDKGRDTFEVPYDILLLGVSHFGQLDLSVDEDVQEWHLELL